MRVEQASSTISGAESGCVRQRRYGERRVWVRYGTRLRLCVVKDDTCSYAVSYDDDFLGLAERRRVCVTVHSFRRGGKRLLCWMIIANEGSLFSTSSFWVFFFLLHLL